MGNRFLLVLHWFVFVGGVLLICVGGFQSYQRVTFERVYYPDDCPPLTEPKNNLKGLDALKNMTFPSKGTRCGDLFWASRRDSAPYKEAYYILMSGIAVLVLISSLVFVVQGRWIWFPWQHDK